MEQVANIRRVCVQWHIRRPRCTCTVLCNAKYIISCSFLRALQQTMSKRIGLLHDERYLYVSTGALLSDMNLVRTRPHEEAESAVLRLASCIHSGPGFIANACAENLLSNSFNAPPSTAGSTRLSVLSPLRFCQPGPSISTRLTDALRLIRLRIRGCHM
jgi:hypothetical protein